MKGDIFENSQYGDMFLTKNGKVVTFIRYNKQINNKIDDTTYVIPVECRLEGYPLFYEMNGYARNPCDYIFGKGAKTYSKEEGDGFSVVKKLSTNEDNLELVREDVIKSLSKQNLKVYKAFEEGKRVEVRGLVDDGWHDFIWYGNPELGKGILLRLMFKQIPYGKASIKFRIKNEDGILFNAKFGDTFITRDGKKAIFLDKMLYRYSDDYNIGFVRIQVATQEKIDYTDGTYKSFANIIDTYDESGKVNVWSKKRDGDDIVGRYYEPTDEKELNEMAHNSVHLLHPHLNVGETIPDYDIKVDLYKLGYKQAKTDNHEK